jgi:DNA-directed RNA polymerase specialized sigma24 family protein
VIGGGFAGVLRAAQEGSAEDFACLWRDANPAMTRYLCVLCSADAQDVAVESWVTVVRGLPAFAGSEGKWRSQLFAAARAHAAEVDQREEWALLPGLGIDAALAGEPRPEIRAEAAGDGVIVEPETESSLGKAVAALRAIPRDEAEVLLLRHVGQLGDDAIGTTVGASPEVVSALAAQAEERLAAGFAEVLTGLTGPARDVELSDEAAVLADPFSVSLHSILHTPPPGGGAALVYGVGTLGLCAIPILRALHPSVRVLAVARFAHQAALAEQLGAHAVLPHAPARAVIAGVAKETGAEEVQPWRGLPVLNGGVDVVYDTVGKPDTLEVGLRVTKTRGRISVTGVEAPRRFEWTPLYYKEIAVVGSNAFGVEQIGGRRQHAMEWYFELVRTRGIDVTPIVTHRFALADWRAAFRTGHDQGATGAVKMLFDYRAGAAG